MVMGKRLPLGPVKIYNVILFLLPRKKNPSRIKPNLICNAERQNASFVLILKHRTALNSVQAALSWVATGFEE